jgi:hypothetical protein
VAGRQPTGAFRVTEPEAELLCSPLRSTAIAWAPPAAQSVPHPMALEGSFFAHEKPGQPRMERRVPIRPRDPASRPKPTRNHRYLLALSPSQADESPSIQAPLVPSFVLSENRGVAGSIPALATRKALQIGRFQSRSTAGVPV